MVRGRASALHPEVAVVGGGIIGLACAWRLLRRGFSVAVVDPPEAAPATWAAGGMLAPLGEAHGPGPFLALALESLRQYPAFVAELQETSGLDVGLHLNGKLLTASTRAQVEALRDRYRWLTSAGQEVRWCDGTEARDLEPALAPEVKAGLLLVGNGRVNPRRVHQALRAAVESAGGRWVSGRVASLESRSGRVAGVRCDDGRQIPAECVVLAAGAWSGQIAGLPRSLPVQPVKGQMLALSAPDRPLNRVATSADAYLIPREGPNGPLVVVGASTEDAGFDESVTAASQEALEAAARRLVPSLADAPVVERWAGLRPGTPDELPVLGRDPELEGLIVAAGHYRNGILLAPATARIVEAAIAGGDVTGVDIAGVEPSAGASEAFSPTRAFRA